MGKREEKSDVLIQMSPDFMARMDEQIKNILVDINTECFRLARANKQPQVAGIMNTYPVLLQIVKLMITDQHEAVCQTVLEANAKAKGPVG